MDPEFGKVTSWISIDIQDKDKVTQKLRVIASQNHDFVLMRCASNTWTERALVFPPVLKKSSDKRSVDKLNINIVILDSISRFHFYRVLPKTVKTMRSIIYDKSIPSTVLDFEMFQSIGQSTFDNIRPLFSGVHAGKVDCIVRLGFPAPSLPPPSFIQFSLTIYASMHFVMSI